MSAEAAARLLADRREDFVRALGMRDEATANRLLEVAAALCGEYLGTAGAARCPGPILEEAIIRCAGYLGASKGLGAGALARVEVGSVTVEAMPGGPSPLLRSGAAALLSRWRVRRGGVIGGTTAPPATALQPATAEAPASVAVVVRTAISVNADLSLAEIEAGLETPLDDNRGDVRLPRWDTGQRYVFFGVPVGSPHIARIIEHGRDHLADPPDFALVGAAIGGYRWWQSISRELPAVGRLVFYLELER